MRKDPFNPLLDKLNEALHELQKELEKKGIPFDPKYLTTRTEQIGDTVHTRLIYWPKEEIP